METKAIAFRLTPERQPMRLDAFNARKEILWFGFRGAFEAPGSAVISIDKLRQGALGGGGTGAINGGVIAAGFDAAFVLAGLGQWDTDTVVTLELSVQFLNLARPTEGLTWQAHVTRSSKRFSFAQAVLCDRSSPGPHFATATAMLAPAA